MTDVLPKAGQVIDAWLPGAFAAGQPPTVVFHRVDAVQDEHLFLSAPDDNLEWHPACRIPTKSTWRLHDEPR